MTFCVDQLSSEAPTAGFVEGTAKSIVTLLLRRKCFAEISGYVGVRGDEELNDVAETLRINAIPEWTIDAASSCWKVDNIPGVPVLELPAKDKLRTRDRE